MSVTEDPRRDDTACVLIVDDEEDVRESLRDVVDMVGCAAATAASGAEALAFLATRRPCLVILDLLMPGMSGAELLDVMRSQPHLAATPVVMSTSAPERAPAGVTVLAKPIDVDALCRWMRQVCRCA